MPTLNETSGIVVITSNVVSGFNGEWFELIASAARDSVWSVVYLAPAEFPYGERCFIDIAIGEIASEVIIADGVYMKMTMDSDFNDSYHSLGLPLRFQTGDRIIARMNDNQSSEVDYHMMLRNFE